MTTEQEVLLSFVNLVFPRELLDYFEVVGDHLINVAKSIRALKQN